MAALFLDAGYEVVDFHQVADVYIVNTCAVTLQAERKSRQALRKTREQNPEATLVMVGCYPQVAKDQLSAMPEIDLIVGSAEKPRVVELVERVRQASSPLIAVSEWTDEARFELISASQEVGRTRATVKVQDGCQQFCSYCIIPYARGPERSRTVESVVEEVAALVQQGFREVVLTGIHLGSYGKDLQPAIELADLVEAVLRVRGLDRLRLSSVEPNEITDSLLALFSRYPNFCRHLHIPLQSGEDHILKAMNRRYDTAQYRQVIEQVRRYVERMAITTDIIVGFPGETDGQFQLTCEFVRSIGFSRMHVFRYSRRPGTPAAALKEQTPAAVKEQRSYTLIDLAEAMGETYRRQMLGETWDVLWESEHEGWWIGHTDTYVKVYTIQQGIQSGSVSPVTITDMWKDGVRGE